MQEVLDKILLDFPKLKDFASFRVEDNEIKYDFTLDYLTYNVEEEWRNFYEYHSDYQYAKIINKFCLDLYFYVLNKCNINGTHTILYFQNRFVVVEKDKINQYRHSKMSDEEIQEEKERNKTIRRKIRNNYLECYVDPIVSNPFRWADLTEEEQNKYKGYRQYLLDYPESSETWYEENPLTWDSWIKTNEIEE